MKKKDTQTDGASEWSSASPSRVTPLDVQQKEFHVTRVGVGYRMREVDEFLDQVTDTLSALIAENERLLREAGGSPAAPSAPPSPAMMSSDGADRMAVDAFLRREKGFLQDLGGLVQAHAEELRTMIREARRGVPGSAAAPAETEPVADSAEETDSAEVPDGPLEAAGDATTDAAGEVAGERDAVIGTVEKSHDPSPDHEEDPPPTITRVVADEPIRVEHPEPARSRRSDEKEGDSLRELFWGEE